MPLCQVLHHWDPADHLLATQRVPVTAATHRHTHKDLQVPMDRVRHLLNLDLVPMDSLWVRKAIGSRFL